MLRIRVSTASAEITETELITAGRVGLQCAFEFNDAWDGLAKTVVIHGGVKRYIVLVGNTILVPGECLARENFPLRIGVYGQDGSGNIVIPTIWVNFGKIRPSAGPIVIPEITPNVAAQIQYNSSEALRIAQEIQEKADNGEFNGRDGATGPRGEDGTDGQNGNSIWTTTETPMPASGGVVFTQLTGRSNVPPIVGDIIVRSSRYVYDVVEVTPGGVVIGHLIGDIKGATGPRGPKGDTGLTGPQGPGVTEDLRAALLQLAQKVAYVDEHGADYYQDLYNALYLPSDIVFITAVFNQGTTKVMDTDSLDSLKPMLTVFGRYDDNTSVVLTNYTLTGVLTPGTSTVTVSALGKTTTFDVLVTGMASISAVYTQSGTVYNTDTLDSLKADLAVTAHYSDSSTSVVPAADYTLSGTLTVGTSTITVAYGGKTTTFSVTVNAVLYNLQNQAVVSSDTGDYFETDINVCQADFACTIFLDVTTTSNPTSGNVNVVPKYLFEFNHASGAGGRCLTIGKQESTDTVLRFWWMSTAANDYYTLTGISPNPGRFRFAVMHGANSDLAVVKCKKDNGEILSLDCTRTFIPGLDTDRFTFGTTGNHGFPPGTIHLARICEGVASSDRINDFFA